MFKSVGICASECASERKVKMIVKNQSGNVTGRNALPPSNLEGELLNTEFGARI